MVGVKANGAPMADKVGLVSKLFEQARESLPALPESWARLTPDEKTARLASMKITPEIKAARRAQIAAVRAKRK
jgi:hypothetical protein